MTDENWSQARLLFAYRESTSQLAASPAPSARKSSGSSPDSRARAALRRRRGPLRPQACDWPSCAVDHAGFFCGPARRPAVCTRRAAGNLYRKSACPGPSGTSTAPCRKACLRTALADANLGEDSIVRNRLADFGHECLENQPDLAVEQGPHLAILRHGRQSLGQLLRARVTHSHPVENPPDMGSDGIHE